MVVDPACARARWRFYLCGQRDLACDCSDAEIFGILARELPRQAVWLTSNLVAHQTDGCGDPRRGIPTALPASSRSRWRLWPNSIWANGRGRSARPSMPRARSGPIPCGLRPRRSGPSVGKLPIWLRASCLPSSALPPSIAAATLLRGNARRHHSRRPGTGAGCATARPRSAFPSTTARSRASTICTRRASPGCGGWLRSITDPALPRRRRRTPRAKSGWLSTRLERATGSRRARPGRGAVHPLLRSAVADAAGGCNRVASSAAAPRRFRGWCACRRGGARN